MPKETKKFINPLLRPSQGSTEPRPVPPSVEAVVDDIPSPLVEEPGEVVVPDADEEKEVLQKPEAEPERVTENVTALASSNSSSQESTTGKGGARESRESGRKSRAVTAPTSRSSTPESMPELDVSEDNDSVYSASEPQAVSARRNTARPVSESRSIVRSAAEGRNGISTPNRAVTFSADDADGSDENISRRSISASDISGGEDERSTPRRRRHVQSFESTHERITLWIDSHLKQDFEDLALIRNTSKTAMLDEAIADLLHKYKG